MDATTSTTALRLRLAARPILAVPAAAVLVAGALGMMTTTARSITPVVARDGIIDMCDNGTPATGNQRVFVLTARDGAIHTADGNSVPMWGFAPDNGAYQYPSPFLCAKLGERVSVILHNAITPVPVAGTATVTPVRTSIMFPGQTGVLARGVSAQPELDGSGNLRSLVPSITSGDSITYSFVAERAGSFLYQSGTNAAVQEQMGLFGGLIVRPTGGQTTASATLYDDALVNSTANPNATDRYDPQREFVQMLSDVDVTVHNNVVDGITIDMATLRPEYFFINGRSMPDTVAPNHASWLPAQPYSALVHVLPYVANGPADGAQITVGGSTFTCKGRCYDPLPAAIRYFNAREKTSPFHPHAADTLVQGFDGNQLVSPSGTNLSINHYVVNLAAGQTADATWLWRDQHAWSPIATHQGPVPVHDFRDTRYTGGGSWYGGTPYLGYTDDLQDGVTSFNECGEYYHVAHSHSVNEATTYGAAMGGMLTLYRIDPPGMWNCGH